MTTVINTPAEAARLYLANEALAGWSYRRFFSRPGGRHLMRRCGGSDAAMQECRTALWQACRRYDPHHGGGCTLSTYVSRCIWCALTSLCTAGQGAIRLPCSGGHQQCLAETREARDRAAVCVRFVARWHDAPAADPCASDLYIAEGYRHRDQALIRAVLDRLESLDALLLQLRYLEGRSLQQIGDMLGCTKEGARLKICRALKAAREVAQVTS